MDINTINKILGVSQKNPVIQKARRSSTITHINNTFIQTVKSAGPLLLRQRDEIDKRAFRYRIAEEHLDKLESSLQAPQT